LRERRGDILPLARRAMQGCARGAQPLSLSPDAERRLVEYDWPGNARELTNIVQRAAWLASGGRIDAADLDLQSLASAAAPAAVAAGSADAGHTALDSTGTHEVGLGKDLKERERELILATLRVTGGSRKLAAERLGISPRTLRHKLQQLKAAGVTVPRLHNEEFAAV
jgi:two-component system response regulator FlrC